jgi:hypothetical protein
MKSDAHRYNVRLNRSGVRINPWCRGIWFGTDIRTLAIRAPAARGRTTSSGVVGAMMAVGLGLAGCTVAGPGPPGPVESPVESQVIVAPGVAFTLLPPGSLGQSVEATQLITARYQNQTFVFETRVSVTPARLLVAGTDMLGRRAMTIEWTGAKLSVETAPWVPAALRAQNIIADIMLLHWPESAVRSGLAPGDTIRDTGPDHRVIAAGGHDMIRIDRTAGASGSWTGRWTYRNEGWGYDLDIQSSEAGP